MSDQIIYDAAGNFQSILRINPDGSQVSYVQGSSLYDAYVLQNGVPPATGTPTFKPSTIARQVHAVFLDLQGLNLNAANITKLVLAITAFQLVNGGSYTGAQLKAYLLAEFPGVTIPDGSQPNP